MGNNVFIQAPSENEVLAKIEMVGDVAIRNALLALFYWRLGVKQLSDPVQTPELKISIQED